VLGFAAWTTLAPGVRDAQRVAAGEPPGGRSRMRDVTLDLLRRCGYAPATGGDHG
jgi:hypothetical protein